MLGMIFAHLFMHTQKTLEELGIDPNILEDFNRLLTSNPEDAKHHPLINEFFPSSFPSPSPFARR